MTVLTNIVDASNSKQRRNSFIIINSIGQCIHSIDSRDLVHVDIYIYSEIIAFSLPLLIFEF